MSSEFTPVSPAELKSAAKRAYIYTVPLVIMETTRKWRMGAGANVFNHARKLLTHRSRWVTTPNNDTLYSDAWLDLSKGPVKITVPATGERYFSLAFMDMYTNNFDILGTRTTGNNGGVYTVVGPHQAVPEDATNVVRAPTPRVWALARILVDGPDDLTAACAVQDGLFVHEGAPSEDVAPGDPVQRSAGWREYLATANRLLRREPPPVTDGLILEQIRALGIGPDQVFDADAFDQEQAEAIERGVEEAKNWLVQIQRARRSAIDGWTYPSMRNGDYGQNYTLRAVVSVGGLGALPLEEAIYMRAEGDAEEGLFDGNQNYRLHFPAGAMPPLNSFWSLTLYEAMDDGQFFFADTPLRRYAVGDRSPGLQYNEDGSLDLWIGARSPGADRESNWLPANEGPFALFFRGYMPKADLMEGRYRLPRVERL
ncbi:DUF1254 domain-containing protein [Alloalcanivorax xenomutans]|uniref:DUF1254 domain-containing protein n=1 Tax=Alloalcanivorax xenomutans TaxID=1094342 RepID=A0A9Q3ZBR6_9GAMM|nr:DUF1254 domain-containing protein [Alloalcanivorax xenomutans]MCE7507913.1 DUF1254 domain-containing protein [Alloalcanivorax xenomutans]MCE7521585.1 DUF1254 domain-containing protein [Alloalcanivorax xenomutans]